MKPFSRSHWIVDRALQFNLVTRIVIFVLFTFCVVSAAVFTPLVREAESRGEAASREAVDLMVTMHERIWPIAGLCLCVGVLGAIFISHRIAGPLVRVKQTMRFVQEGHFPRPIATRPRDYFHNEVDVLNEMVTGLSERVDDLARRNAALQVAVQRCGSSFEHAETGMRQPFEDVVARAADVDAALGQFSSDPSPEKHQAREHDPLVDTGL